MNIILFLILTAALVVGFIQFKRNKEDVKEVPPPEPERDRHSAKKMKKALQMQDFWSNQCRNVYKQIHEL